MVVPPATAALPVPPPKMAAKMPPELTVVSLARPPDQTSSNPPLRMMLPLAVPAEKIWRSPLSAIVVALGDAAGGDVFVTVAADGRADGAAAGIDILGG